MFKAYSINHLTLTEQMKKFLFILMALWAVNASAQDVIVKKDGSTIVSKVLEITSTEVKYKKFTNQNGPTYTIPKTEIQAINYENGEKETFGEVKAAGEKQATQQQESIIRPATSQLNRQTSDIELMKMAGVLGLDEKAKKLKRNGWIAGGVLTGAGALFMAIIAGANLPPDDNGYVGDLFGVGMGCGALVMVSGITTMIVCRSKAKKLQQIAGYSVQSTPLYHQDFALRNGSSLSTGVDVLSDNRLHTQTVGLGLRYNF